MTDPDVMYCQHGLRWLGVNAVDGHTFEASSAPALHGLIAGHYQVDPVKVRMHPGEYPGPVHPLVVVDHGLAITERRYAHQQIVRTCSGHALRLSVEQVLSPRRRFRAAAEVWTAGGWTPITAIPADTAAAATLPVWTASHEAPPVAALAEAVGALFERLYRDALVVIDGMSPVTPATPAS